MVKKLAIAYSAGANVYAIIRRRRNGNIYNPVTGKEEAVGTWNDARKQACAVSMTDLGGGYYSGDMPGGCDEGVWDAFYYVMSGVNVSINDRLTGRDKFINGSASIAERTMLAAAQETGETIYAVIRSQDDANVWDISGSTLEEAGTWDNTRLAECAYAMDDKGGGYYTRQFPAECTTAGTYHILYHRKAGASSDINDRLIGRDKIYWTGTTESGDVLPTGPRGKAMVNLKNLISECESFQAGTGAADSQDVKQYIHLTAYEPAGGVFARPFALIHRTANDRDEEIAIATNTVGGDLELRFEQEIPEDYEDEPANAELYFLNWVEAVLKEMRTISRQPGKFGINDITLLDGPSQLEVETKTYVYGVRYQINWGIKNNS